MADLILQTTVAQMVLGGRIIMEVAVQPGAGELQLALVDQAKHWKILNNLSRLLGASDASRRDSEIV